MKKIFIAVAVALAAMTVSVDAKPYRNGVNLKKEVGYDWKNWCQEEDVDEESSRTVIVCADPSGYGPLYFTNQYKIYARLDRPEKPKRIDILKIKVGDKISDVDGFNFVKWCEPNPATTVCMKPNDGKLPVFFIDNGVITEVLKDRDGNY